MMPVDRGDTTYRNALLRACLDKGMPNDAIAEIVAPMRGKTSEEKEQLAKEALEKL